MIARLSARLAVLALLSALVAIPAQAEELVWRDWNDGLREAKARGLPIVVDVYTDWCGWCKRMDRDVYARSDVREFLGRRFVNVKLDAESSAPARYQGEDHTARSIASRFRVTGYPTTIFLEANGEHVVTVPGYLPSGRFLLLLRYIGDGHFERGESFQDFQKAQGAAR